MPEVAVDVVLVPRIPDIDGVIDNLDFTRVKRQRQFWKVVAAGRECETIFGDRPWELSVADVGCSSGVTASRKRQIPVVAAGRPIFVDQKNLDVDGVEIVRYLGDDRAAFRDVPRKFLAIYGETEFTFHRVDVDVFGDSGVGHQFISTIVFSHTSRVPARQATRPGSRGMLSRCLSSVSPSACSTMDGHVYAIR